MGISDFVKGGRERNFINFRLLVVRRKMKKTFIIAILTLILTACGSGTPIPTFTYPSQDVNAIYTNAAQTSQVQTPINTATPPPASITPSPIPTTAETQSNQSTAAITTGCQDAAQYVTDDGRDGTTYAPNIPFTKMWRVKNTGTCIWDSTYIVAYVSGANMTQSPWYMLVPAGSTVPPGATVDVSVGMTSPATAGEYSADWRIQNSSGAKLVQFYLALKVQDQSTGAAAGGITNVVTQIVPEQGSGNPCNPDSTYFVTVNVTSNGAATAGYRIDLTDASGQVANGAFSFVDFVSPEAQGSLTFNGAGTQNILLRVVGPYAYPSQMTVRVMINGQAWSPATAGCQ